MRTFFQRCFFPSSSYWPNDWRKVVCYLECWLALLTSDKVIVRYRIHLAFSGICKAEQRPTVHLNDTPVNMGYTWTNYGTPEWHTWTLTDADRIDFREIPETHPEFHRHRLHNPTTSTAHQYSIVYVKPAHGTFNALLQPLSVSSLSSTQVIKCSMINRQRTEVIMVLRIDSWHKMQC